MGVTYNKEEKHFLINILNRKTPYRKLVGGNNNI
ncbi:hypothetical protein BACERE00177_05074 [Bacillus mobilis]|nr:hypothetical protein BACERE00177_05074 [Bacillus mobilis]